ncbi:MAG: GH25 family lysozyme [Bacteroidota bacterium]
MIAIVELLAGLVKTRSGKLIGLIAFAAVVIFFVWSLRGTGAGKNNVPVISLLQSVKNIERLDLLSYRTDEVLMLGDPDVLQRMIDKVSADSIKTYKTVRKLSMEIEQNTVALQSVSFDQQEAQEDVEKQRNKVAFLYGEYNRLPKTFEKLLKTLPKLTSQDVDKFFGKSMESAWESYQVAVSRESIAPDRSALKEAEKAAASSKKELKRLWLSNRKSLFDAWKAADQLLKSQEKDAAHATHTRLINHLDKEIANLKAKRSSETIKLKQDSAKIGYLRTSIASNEASLDPAAQKNERLLAILPTKTNLYLNLSTVDIKLTRDSTILVTIDSIHHEPVQVLVDSSIHYNIAQQKVELKGQKEGLYMQVFQQLQTGIQVIKDRIAADLQSAYFKEEALTKAKDYFSGLYQALGYKVTIQYGSIPQQAKTNVSQVTTVSQKRSKPPMTAQNTAAASVSAKRKTKAPVSKTIDRKNKELSAGIDVSHFNGMIQWAQVKAQGIDFAYAKATQGYGYTDPMFGENWSAIADAKVRRGAYHFYVPSDPPEAQAEHFIKTVGDLAKGDLPPMLDIEDTDMGEMSKELFQENVLKWLDLIEQHYGVKPIVYTYTPYANEYLTDSKFANYKLWIAEYTQASEPLIPEAWKNQGWYMWQYTAHDELKGINGYVDRDKMK